MDLRVLPAVEDAVLKQVSLLGMKNLLVTLDASPIGPATAAEVSAHELELTDPSITGSFLSVLLREAKRVGRESREIRSAVFRLDEQMDREPGDVSLEEILALRDRLLRLLAIAEEQSECFKELTAFENTCLDFSRLPGTMHLLLSVAGCSERMAERLESGSPISASATTRSNRKS